MSIFLFNPLLAGYMLLIAFLIGACAGSFTNCAVIRLSHKSGSLFGRSACPKCGHALGFLDLIPVFGYIFLGGKCRYCKARVSPRYLAVELAFGFGYAGILAVFGLSWITLEYLLMFTLLCAEALSDIETFEVSNWLHLALVAVFLLFLPTHAEPLERLISGALGLLIYGGGMLIIALIADKAYKKEALGGADIKLFGVLGLYFGPIKMLFLTIISCVAGLFAAMIAKKGLGKEFPFIPAIAFGAYITALFADSAVAWYLGLFGFSAHIH